MANLTPTAIDALRVGRRLTDKTPGLVVVALNNGKKVFRYSRRVPRTMRVHNATLGPFPSFNLVEAREWAQAFNAMIDRGIDPVEAQEASEKAAMTVADAFALYMQAVRSGTHKARERTIKPRTIADKEAIYKRDIAPKLGNMALADVTADMLWDIVEEKGNPEVGKPAKVRANRLAAEFKVFFKFCCFRNGSRAIGLAADPSTCLSGTRFEQKPRTRFLSHAEIAWFLRAVATERRNHRRALILMLLTAGRKSEVVEARRSEYEDGDWIIPDVRSKNSQALLLPLSPWGRSIFAVNTDWIFPSDRKDDGPQLEWYHVFDRVREKMEKLAGRTVLTFRPHDLRRTFRSNTKPLRIDRDVAEAIMHHKKTGLEEIYDLHDLKPEKAEALAKWENFLIDIARREGVAEALEIPE